MPPELVRPRWPAPAGVGAAMSTRLGGVSRAPYDSLNLRPPGLRGDAADAPGDVFENQRRFAAAIGARPVWLDQVHGRGVVRVGAGTPADVLPVADASVTTDRGVACTVLVADCLPVLLCARSGAAVGAAHAGWRGLAAGVLESAVAALCDAAACGPADVFAWLGPCIGPRRFEVGADVVEAFGGESARFVPHPRPDGAARWLADLPGLARERLARAGVSGVTVDGSCTVEDAGRFFSFRRDRLTGRMAAAVWRCPEGAATT